MTKCWMCFTEIEFSGGELTKHCPECGVENDIVNQDTSKKEVQVVKVASVNSMSPFFKKGMLTEGAVGVIKGEFAPSGKFNNYTGEVDFDGVLIKVSLSKTSLYDIVRAYGDDTSAWVGKQIVYSVEDIENKKTNALFRGCNVFRAFR